MWNTSMIILIFLLGFNLGGMTYSKIYNKDIKGTVLGVVGTLVILILNLIIRLLTPI